MELFKSQNISYQSKNVGGVNIHLLEKKGAPIYIRVILKAGSRYETKRGSAHFLEHMLVSKTEMFSSKDLIAEYIEGIGGKFALYTTTEFIYIDVEISDKEDIDTAANFLDQMVNKTIFDNYVFENERGAILSEYQTIKTNQERYIWEVYARLLFQETSLSKTPIGTEESIRSINIDDLKEFQEKYFTRENMSVIASGDIDLELLCSKIEKILPEKIGYGQNTEDIIIVRNKSVDMEYYQSKQASVVLGFRTKNYNLKNEAVGDICASYLGQGRASLLMKKLRYEKGLVYHVYTNNTMTKEKGEFFVGSNCNNDKTKEVIEIIKETINEVKEHSIPSDKISFIKSKIIKSLKIKLQTSQNLAMQNQRLILNWNKTIEDYIYEVEKTTNDDINKFIQENINLDSMYTAICGDVSLN